MQTSFSNSHDLLKVQYTGLVAVGGQLAMNYTKDSVWIHHLLPTDQVPVV